jgi:hypothetical protein
MQYPKLILFAIPNGGKRGIVEASIMKAEGVLSGVPDLFLAHARIDDDQDAVQYNGLFLEMKSERGRLTDSQKEIHAALRRENFAVEVCRSFDEFRASVENYLKE